MIVFKFIEFRNFLSTGDTPTRIDLDSAQTTLVVGANGSGKSTMLDALSFALFGKPHRNINKGQIPNTINQKDCVVEVEFAIENSIYNIRRGIKPNIFEIRLNGKLLNQESHSRDYQKMLETNILKLNHKSFHQVVVLGSSNFIPFMQLGAAARREVIEDLLDIRVFAKMNVLVKERQIKLRDSIRDIDSTVTSLKDRIDLQSRHIRELRELDDQKTKEIRDEIDELGKESKKLDEESSEHLKEYADNHERVSKEFQKLRDDEKMLNESKQEVRGKLAELVKQGKVFRDESTCPTCEQEITEEFKKIRIQELQVSADGLGEALDFANDMLGKNAEQMKGLQASWDTLVAQKRKGDDLALKRRGIEGQVSKLLERLQQDTKGGDDIGKRQGELNDMVDAMGELTHKHRKTVEDRSYNEAISEILKDTGIKTKVIRQYLPAMNRLINTYLGVLDLFVAFHLDDALNETLRSRHRDKFTYPSFSEGEKARIDLALLFAWREVARMKNSVNTNLLVLDEVFDSSLDVEGAENLQKILGTLDESTRVVVISHKTDVLEGKFERKIEFRKPNNFSQMTISR